MSIATEALAFTRAAVEDDEASSNQVDVRSTAPRTARQSASPDRARRGWASFTESAAGPCGFVRRCPEDTGSGASVGRRSAGRRSFAGGRGVTRGLAVTTAGRAAARGDRRPVGRKPFPNGQLWSASTSMRVPRALAPKQPSAVCGHGSGWHRPLSRRSLEDLPGQARASRPPCGSLGLHAYMV